MSLAEESNRFPNSLSPCTDGSVKPGDRIQEETASHAILEVQNVSKWFGGVTALSDVSLTVNAGEIVGIVGNNGAGKSTLMRILAGVHRPDAGELRVRGQRVELRAPWEARSRGIEFVPQELALAEHLTVAANMFLGREMTRQAGPFKLLDQKQMNQGAERLLARFGINIPNVKAPVYHLSGGQKQGIAIGRAVAWGSKIIILDEPTAALGVRETKQVEELLLSLREEGVGMLMVSHDLDQLFRVSNRLYVLRHSKLVAQCETAQVSRERVVSHITGADIEG